MGNPGDSPRTEDASSEDLPGQVYNASDSDAQGREQRTNEEDMKRQSISRACLDRDITALVSLADTQGGLLDDNLRKDAWPLLLGCKDPSPKEVDHSSWEKLPRHKDEEQVELDVNRAFVYYPTGN